ncbi:uncharacterized protein PAC_11234 [Phialocephala subalpina]|uniref:Uncharacterized protein n=1 Tax=Phialocephala subalpina TaxID=576137 RepID=A0A1L7X8I0_9HELO|nr:uncharacterized protein PAC_11234 [Phialocephala subalpina]
MSPPPTSRRETSQKSKSYRATSRHSEASETPRSYRSTTTDKPHQHKVSLSEVPEEHEEEDGPEGVVSELGRNRMGIMDRTLVEGIVKKTGFESIKSKTAEMFSRASTTQSSRTRSKVPSSKARTPSIRPPPSLSPPPSQGSDTSRSSRSESIRTPSARALSVRHPSHLQPSQKALSEQCSSQSKQTSKPQKSSSKANSKPGMIGLTQYENHSLIPATYPAITKPPSPSLSTKSRAPPTVKSIFTFPGDAEMGARQTIINTLSPDERQEQEKRAMNHLRLTAACPDSFTWKSIDEGYHCNGEHHLITNEVLAEGKGGVFLIGGDLESKRWGPYYASNGETEGLLWYAGPETRHGAAT